MTEPSWKSGSQPPEPAPVAHAGEEPEEFVVDPTVEAYVTTLTISVAHNNETDPYEVVNSIARVVEGMGLQGVVTGVSAVELRGSGGLLGL